MGLSLRFRIAILVSAITAVVLLFTAYPPLYDNIVWRYFWGPVMADAAGVTHLYHNGIGANSGYNMVNTLTYAIFTVVILYLISTKLRGKIRSSASLSFFRALAPLIVYGSVTRVLEDSGLFLTTAMRAFFITPLIYVHILIAFTAVLMASLILEKKKFYNVPVIIGIVTTISMIFIIRDSIAVLPNVLYLSAISLGVALASFRFKGWSKQAFLFSLFLLLLSLYYPVRWVSVGPWSYSTGINFFALASFIPPTIAVAIICSLIPWTREPLAPLAIFSQTFDAAATWIGIDFFSYYEKHVLPSFLIDITGSATVMIPIKILLVVLVLYAIRDEDPIIKNIIKMMVIIFGLAPGMRDMLRIFLGV